MTDHHRQPDPFPGDHWDQLVSIARQLDAAGFAGWSPEAVADAVKRFEAGAPLDLDGLTPGLAEMIQARGHRHRKADLELDFEAIPSMTMFDDRLVIGTLFDLPMMVSDHVARLTAGGLDGVWEPLVTDAEAQLTIEAATSIAAAAYRADREDAAGLDPDDWSSLVRAATGALCGLVLVAVVTAWILWRR